MTESLTLYERVCLIAMNRESTMPKTDNVVAVCPNCYSSNIMLAPTVKHVHDDEPEFASVVTVCRDCTQQTIMCQLTWRKL